MNWGEKLGKMVFLERRLKGIKNHSIWISNHGEIKDEVGINFRNREEHKS